MEYDPASFTEDLFTGETATQILTLSNDLGGSNLEFSISVQNIIPMAVSIDLTQLNLNQVSGSDPYKEYITSPTIGLGYVLQYTGPTPTSSASLFAIDASSNQIVQLDPTDGTELNSYAAPEPVSGGPDGFAYDGTYLYFVNGFGSNNIYQLDPNSGAVISTISIPGLPSIDALGHSGTYLYALDFSNDLLYEIDDSSASVIRIIDVGGSLGGGISYGGSRASVFISNLSSTISEVDLST